MPHRPAFGSTNISLPIARELGLGEALCHHIQVAALLHDIGKIGVPDSVLRKPGRLTGDEYEAIKQHAPMGASIVGAVPGFEETLDVVRHHHEHWDGAGYPFGLQGTDIPQIARIMARGGRFFRHDHGPPVSERHGPRVRRGIHPGPYFTRPE